MSFLRCTILLVLLVCGFAAFAQPNPYGCHFFKHAPAIAQVKSDINSTIARSDTFDILHYDLRLDVTNYAGQILRGEATITFVPIMSGQQRIRFDLLQLTVDSVVRGGEMLPFVQDDEFLTMEFPEVLAVGVPQDVTVYYGGTPHRDTNWGGFYFQQNYIYNLGIGISSIPPNFGKVWYPCFDSFVERATYTYHVKSAGTFRLHGQGNLVEEIQLGGDTVIRSYSFMEQIPTHLSAIAVADYQVHEYLHPGLNGEIPVTLKAKPAQLTGMVNKFGQLPDAIDVCEYWYGPYPYDRVGYIHTIDGALEIPTNVAYPDFMNNQTEASNRGLYTHELGHHWWGDIVTPHVHNDMWLKEGPAEYSGHLVEEWISGHPGLVKAVKDNLLYVLRQAHLNDEGFHALSPMPDPHIYGSHTYYKGALVMHNMRGYMGDSLFRQAMRGVQEDLALTTITPEQFRDALEANSGVDLDAFFDAWVFSPSYSVFEVLSSQATQCGAEWNVQMSIGQKLRGGSTLHDLVPLDLTFISVNNEIHEQMITVGGLLTDLTVTSPFEPAMIVLNRNARLNQARLDQEVTINAGQTFDQNLSYAEVRAYCDVTPGDVLLRVEHMWVAPDQAPLTADVVEISGTHYWNVDGLWPEGAALRARFQYQGLQPEQLDHELFSGDETNMCILYREKPTDPWEVSLDQTVSAGSLLNGQGTIMVNPLRRGQYAFGKAIGFVNVEEPDAPADRSLEVYPVPARDMITCAGVVPVESTVIIDLLSADGRIVSRTVAPRGDTFKVNVDVSRHGPGTYLVRAMNTQGLVAGTKKIEVVR